MAAALVHLENKSSAHLRHTVRRTSAGFTTQPVAGRTVAGNLNSCSASTRIAYIYYVDALACGCDAFAAHPINALPRVIRPHHPRCPAGVRSLAPGIRCATTAATMRCTENLVDIGADVAVVVYMFVCQADKENGHYAA